MTQQDSDEQLNSYLNDRERYRKMLGDLDIVIHDLRESKKPFIEKEKNFDLINNLLDNVNKDSKIQLYRDNGGSDMIIKMLESNTSPSQFGSLMENITKQLFNGTDRLSNDHDFLINGFKIEQKCSTMKTEQLKKGKKFYFYDSIRPDFDYDYLMFCNVDFKKLDYYLIKKQDFLAIKLGLKQKRKKNHNIISISFDKVKDYVIKITPDNYNEYLR